MEKLREPLPPAERAEVAGMDTTYPQAKGRLGYVELGSNPLNLPQLVLKENDGICHVTEPL
ncbi:hypothetical protein OG988_39425 [Streptomyces zaomyceticus]|uniref:Uncharacterized protein n=1 Tax=Streptomyces zaomyceticus TaxID=68286 RepID=A0ABZ1LNU4_9ACTN|nr:hypothetical protein OG237_00710 [Streptomyces zaomyceticus]